MFVNGKPNFFTRGFGTGSRLDLPTQNAHDKLVVGRLAAQSRPPTRILAYFRERRLANQRAGHWPTSNSQIWGAKMMYKSGFASGQVHKFISKKLQILHYILSVNLFAPPYQGRGPKTTAIFPMLPTTPKLAFGGRESVLGRLALLEVGSEGRPRIFLRFPPRIYPC